MVLVYVISVILMKYTIPYRKICYLLKRIWHTVSCFLWTKHLKAAYYNSEYLFSTLIFSSTMYHDRKAFMINSDPACTQTYIYRVENVCNGKSITNTLLTAIHHISSDKHITRKSWTTTGAWPNMAAGTASHPWPRKSVVFCCRGKHTEITPVTDGLLLSSGFTCGGRCSRRCPLTRSMLLGGWFWSGRTTLAPARCGYKVNEFCEFVQTLCPAPHREHIMDKVVNEVPLPVVRAEVSLHVTPSAHDCVGMNASPLVNELYAMVDGVVCVISLFEMAVRTPAVTDDRSAGFDPCIYNGHQSVGGSVHNGKEKRSPGLALNTAKHPLPLYRVAPAVFPLTELALVDLWSC